MMIQFAKENLDFSLHVHFADSISRAPAVHRALNSVEELLRDKIWFLSFGSSQTNGDPRHRHFY